MRVSLSMGLTCCATAAGVRAGLWGISFHKTGALNNTVGGFDDKVDDVRQQVDVINSTHKELL